MSMRPPTWRRKGLPRLAPQVSMNEMVGIYRSMSDAFCKILKHTTWHHDVAHSLKPRTVNSGPYKQIPTQYSPDVSGG